MDANELLDRLSGYSRDELHLLRKSPVLDQFPTDPAVYVAIAKEFFASQDDDVERSDRLVQILCEFLYRDGRSLEALLWVAERAFRGIDYFPVGVNALAGIYCYLGSGRQARISDEELVAKFQELMQDDNLRNNAAQCRNLILQRRPDLAD